MHRLRGWDAIMWNCSTPAVLQWQPLVTGDMAIAVRIWTVCPDWTLWIGAKR